jgi:lysophospholipase L1-like esterase
VADSFVTISGDTVATLTPTGGQTYCFARLVSGIYTPIPDVELTGYYNLNRTIVDKAWLKNVKAESSTLKVPNVTGTIYLIINTRYQATIATVIFSNKETLQIEVGKIATQYEKRNSIVLNNIEGFEQAKPYVKNTRWSGSWGMFFGDSVTDGQTGSKNRMVGLVSTAVGLSRYTNYASSGSDTTRLYQIVTGTYTTPFNVVPDYLSYDVLVLMVGHNADATVGTIADCEGVAQPNTFYGNISKSIDFILGINPNIKIYLSNVHYTDRQAGAGTNSKNIDTRINEICEFYSLSKIDVFRNSGINKKNIATYLLDGTHPNPNGEVLLARAIELGMTKGY